MIFPHWAQLDIVIFVKIRHHEFGYFSDWYYLAQRKLETLKSLAF